MRLENQMNDLGMAVGFPVEGWQGANSPGDNVLIGHYCRCEPLDIEKHSEELYEAFLADEEGRVWVYLPYGPFESLGDYQAWMRNECQSTDPCFYAIVDKQTEKALGVASYLRINPQAGSIEVGHINYSPALQNTVAASEAMYLMMRNVFELGYRRYEWKCNALNERSRSAAKRLGFTYEGTFRQMLVVKGRNRDSAWFSILDCEWPVLQPAHESWLSPDNFDESGRQRESLSGLTASFLSSVEF